MNGKRTSARAFSFSGKKKIDLSKEGEISRLGRHLSKKGRRRPSSRAMSKREKSALSWGSLQRGGRKTKTNVPPRRKRKSR